MVTPNGVVDPADDTLISIVDHAVKMPYGKVKSAVIHRGGKYYFKDDEKHIVRVQTEPGKYGLFRKESKLIVKTPDGFSLRKNCVTTDDGLILDKVLGNAVKLSNGKWVHNKYVIEVDGEKLLMTDPEIVSCQLTGNRVLRRNCVELDSSFYSPPNIYVESRLQHRLCVHHPSGMFILPTNAIQVMSEDGSVHHYHRHTRGGNFVEVFYKFKDATNPQLGRIDNVLIEHEHYKKYCRPVFINGPLEPALYIHNAHYDQFMEIYNNVILVARAKATAELKAALTYSDDGLDENMAKDVKKSQGPFPGKHNIYTPRNRKPIISNTFKLTGGLRYTYGVEIETSQGMLPAKLADTWGAAIVGDRSIGAGEYVTPVLKGDVGMTVLIGLCTDLAQHTFVDDKCAVHVHVKGDGPFTRHFAINSIKLGCQIEKELYLTCPPSRGPMLKHCHSIMRYKGINEDNWRAYLGAFVFGPEENWKNPFPIMQYSYGSEGQNKERRCDNWCGGRYKWLNLVHVLSQSNIGTFEIRLFPGSTNATKIVNYTLASMAFVWFVENRSGRINEGNVTLNEVLSTPFEVHNHPEVGQQLVEFYESRKAKFNRNPDTLYPLVIPNP